MKDITISPALNGWKVKVGCQEVLFTNRKTMLEEISRYINDPNNIEEEYLSRAKNKFYKYGTDIFVSSDLNRADSSGIQIDKFKTTQ
jgi:hypothetical protein